MKHLVVLILLLLFMTIIVVYNRVSHYSLGLPFKIVYALIFGLLILAVINSITKKNKESFEILIHNNTEK